MGAKMNIISWNVNGIRAVEKKGFVDWLTQTDADVVCIQETKANPGQLSPELVHLSRQRQKRSAYLIWLFEREEYKGLSSCIH